MFYMHLHLAIGQAINIFLLTLTTKAVNPVDFMELLQLSDIFSTVITLILGIYLWFFFTDIIISLYNDKSGFTEFCVICLIVVSLLILNITLVDIKNMYLQMNINFNTKYCYDI